MHPWMIWFKLKLPLAEEEDEEGCVLVFGNKQVCEKKVKVEKLPEDKGCVLF